MGQFTYFIPSLIKILVYCAALIERVWDSSFVASRESMEDGSCVPEHTCYKQQCRCVDKLVSKMLLITYLNNKVQTCYMVVFIS